MKSLGVHWTLVAVWSLVVMGLMTPAFSEAASSSNNQFLSSDRVEALLKGVFQNYAVPQKLQNILHLNSAIESGLLINDGVSAEDRVRYRLGSKGQDQLLRVVEGGPECAINLDANRTSEHLADPAQPEQQPRAQKKLDFENLDSWLQVRRYPAQVTLKLSTSHIRAIELKTNPDGAQAFCREQAEQRLIFAISRAYDVVTKSSSDDQFHKLTFFGDTPAPEFVYKSRNKLRTRLIDAKELENTEIAFATNLSFFQIDPEFACRRPSLTQYFNHFFTQLDQHQSASGAPIGQASAQEVPNPNYSSQTTGAFQAKSCIRNSHEKFNSRLLISQPNQLAPFAPVGFDFAQIYQIHLLVAGEGRDISSRFGHAMLRIVKCAPWRKSVGPDCMNDEDYHLVVGFRAGMTDLTIDNMKGLKGDYPSQLNIYNFRSIIEEYTQGDLRRVTSYPLQLNPIEIQSLAERILEVFYQYQGSYYFISNNCATEVFYLLQSVLYRDGMNQKMDSVPVHLPELLSRYGLISRSDLKRPSQPKFGYDYSSRGTELDEMFERILTDLKDFARETKLGNVRNWTEYLSQSTSESRWSDFKKLREGQNFAQIQKLAAIYLQFEIYVQSALEKKRTSAFTELMITLDNDPGKFKLLSNDVLGLFKDASAMWKSMGGLHPSMMLKAGAYGIPQDGDWKTTDVISEDLLLNKLQLTIDSIFPLMASDIKISSAFQDAYRAVVIGRE